MIMKHKAIILVSCLVLCLLVPGVSANVLSITPSSALLQTGETQSYDVVLDSAPQGLSGFNITIAIENTAVAEITGVSFPTWANPNSNGTVPSASIWCKAADLANQSGMQNIVLCTFTVRAVGTGTTNINFTSVKLDDTLGGRYSPSLVPSVLIVGGGGTSTVGIFRSGNFFLASTNTNGGGTVNAFNFGQTGDVPVAGDWSGSGTSTVGIFRTGNFFLASTNTPGGGTVNAFNFGQEGDVPVAGKWSGSGAATVGIFRSGNFYLAGSNIPGGGTVNAFNFGQAGDIPVAGDWTGSGTTTVGIFRSGAFFLASSNTPGGGMVNAFTFGQAGDVPVTGDWNADGTTEVGIFRNGAFYLASRNENGGGTVTAFGYGMTGDVPVAGKWT